MLWSSIDKIRDTLGKDSILIRIGEVDGAPCFILGLPVDRWERDGKKVFPKELIEQDPAPLAISPARVGNSGAKPPESVGNSPALAISPASVGNSEEQDPAPLAIQKKEDRK